MIALLAFVIAVDPGVDGGNVSSCFTATTPGFYGQKLDSGVAAGAFMCPGVANGVPCLSNPKGIIELYGHVLPENTPELTVCDVELYAELDRSAGCVMGVGVGPTSNKVFVVGPQGQTYQQGNVYLRGNSTRVEAQTSNHALELRGNLAPNTSGYPGVWLSNAQRLGVGQDAVQVLRVGPTEIVARVDYGGGFVSAAAASTSTLDHSAAFNATGTAAMLHATGQPVANFGPCALPDAGTQFASDLRYGSDTHLLYFCNGTAWQEVYAGTTPWSTVLGCLVVAGATGGLLAAGSRRKPVQ